MEISKIDSNFSTGCKADEQGLIFRDGHTAPFCLYGVCAGQGNAYMRIAQSFADTIGEKLAALAPHTAGIRLRFSTNSKTIALRVKAPPLCAMSHMTLCGQAGFDLYEDKNGESRFVGSFLPPEGFCGGYTQSLELPNDGMHRLTLNFPLYHSVSALEIGLCKEAVLARGEQYIADKPILFYGSSITQGGCASRPGNAYEAIISRRLNRDYINLGFSGSARGEPAMAQYIAEQSICAFVCDYDYNAPTVQHLQNTHYPFYATVRNKNPELPIILISKPNYSPQNQDDNARRDVINATYQKGLSLGDKRLWFIDGDTLFDKCDRDCSTVDGCHPNDFGFVFMARKIGDTLAAALNS